MSPERFERGGNQDDPEQQLQHLRRCSFFAAVEKCYHLLTILGFVNRLRPAIGWEWP
jgi:hypothetical protein